MSIVIIIFILLHVVGILEPVERGLVSLLSGVTGRVYSLTEHTNNRNIDELISYTGDLESQIKQCTIDTATYELLQEENNQLRAQLNFFSSTTEFQHVGADVIGRTVDPLGTTILISKGFEDGLREGNAVVVYNGILVGSIKKVEKNTAIVRLINDNGSRIGAMLINGEKSIGLVEGGHGLGVRMDFIPQNEVLSPGDIVVTSGLTEGMPRGLVIGTVEVVEKQPHEPFQQAVIQPTAQLNHIFSVSVITYSAV